MGIIIETANVGAAELTVGNPWEFTWGPIRNGACTMLEGAKWTLFPHGTATFDATVTGGAVWMIWNVDLVDRNGTVLGSLISEHPIEGDWRKFVLTMPNSTERYRFRAWATFDTALWNDIESLKMYSSC